MLAEIKGLEIPSGFTFSYTDAFQELSVYDLDTAQ